MGIQSFGAQATKNFYQTGKVPKGAGWSNAADVAARKLDMLNYASKLLDLRSPPGNRLEGLKGLLKGYHSIRINDQWRAIFVWTDSGPKNVQIVDYHD